MAFLSIRGGTCLKGEVVNSGAKNGALPVLAACLLVQGRCVIRNCPDIADVRTTLEILTSLGCRVQRQGLAVSVDAAEVHTSQIPAELAGQMRASILFLGALYARLGQASIARPGGCSLGERPVDLHLLAMRNLGAEILEEETTVSCRRKGPDGGFVHFSYPSVGATENAILAAVGCKHDSILHGCAKEPEIADLCCFLNACGAKIIGAGSETIYVCGGRKLKGTEHTVLPDRMEAVSYLCAAAGCGGEVSILRTDASLYRTELDLLQAAGCQITAKDDTVHLLSPEQLRPVPLLTTAPYPRLSTDAQPPLMAALLRADGVSRFCETVFENRYSHVSQMQKLGAKLKSFGRYVRLYGGAPLHGAALQAEDLRAAAALVIAAMMAEGESTLHGLSHLQRGYVDFPGKLCALGAQIELRN